MDPGKVEHLYQSRRAPGWKSRIRRALEPPAPFVMNPREAIDAPLGRWNLYIGGAGNQVDGYVNVDLFCLPGVDVAADAEQLPVPRGRLSARGVRRRAGARARSGAGDARDRARAGARRLRSTW